MKLNRILLLISLLLVSCTDVVNVDVPTGKERLVVEASINWFKGTLGNEQEIKLSKSTPFFARNRLNPIANAQVKVVNTISGASFVFNHTENGVYKTTHFVPVLNASYSLEIIYHGNTYTAKETLLPVSKITRVEQTKDHGFTDEDIEVRIYFNDPPNVENNYLARFKSSGKTLAYLETLEDEFVDGNQNFFEYEDEDFKVDDQLDITLFGISKAYYNYMTLLIEQSDSDGFRIPTPLIGNCKNINDTKEEVLGYFRLSEADKANHRIQ